MTTDNLALVFDHLQARRAEDVALLAAQLDPHVVHQGVLPELVCSGRDAVLARIRASFPQDGAGIDHIELFGAGDAVVLGLGGPRFQMAPHGPLSGQIFMVFTFRDGRIVRIADHLTRDEALRTAGGATRDWS